MSNVYDSVKREEFLKHRMFTDPKSAEIISELVRHCDYFRDEISLAWKEMHCCDDIKLNQPLNSAICELQRSRDELRARIAKLLPKCPTCGETATYQTLDGTFWDSWAHYWRTK